MKLKTLYFLTLIMVFVLFSHSRTAAQMTDSSEYVSIVKMLQQRGHVGEGTVRIDQSSAIEQLLNQNAYTNQRNQSMQGYRIRIYRDNYQNARGRSEQVMNTFKVRYPEIGAYRSYTNPYFMVTIGDFRTVDEANKFQSRLTADYGGEYSSTYIIKEKTHLPPLTNYERQY